MTVNVEDFAYSSSTTEHVVLWITIASTAGAVVLLPCPSVALFLTHLFLSDCFKLSDS